MEEAGLPSFLSSIDSENEYEVGFLGTKALIAQNRREIEAILAGSDTTAYGAYAALREAEIDVPRLVSVCGFNDTPDASLLHPPLTSVSVFPDLIGRTLAEMLIERITQPNLPFQHRVLHTQLVKRESCLPSLRTRVETREQKKFELSP
jgi:DNA-binding LacI/PurR family transcriptional regulator